MFRFFTALILVGVLGACSTQDGASTDQSLDANPSTDTATSADASGAAGSSAGEPSEACVGAFSPLAEMGLESTSDLGDLAEVEATVERCESIADWIAGAQQVVEGEVSPGGAELLLRIRCESPSLSDTVICEELASS